MNCDLIHIDLAVPMGWHELSDAQLRYAFELIARNYTSDEIKTLCLFRWSGLSVRHRHNSDYICRLRKQTFRLTARLPPTSPTWPLRNSSSATISIKATSQPNVMICSTNSQASSIIITSQPITFHLLTE